MCIRISKFIKLLFWILKSLMFSKSVFMFLPISKSRISLNQIMKSSLFQTPPFFFLLSEIRLPTSNQNVILELFFFKFEVLKKMIGSGERGVHGV